MLCTTYCWIMQIHSEAADLDKRVDALKAKEVQRLHHELKSAKSQMDTVIKNFEIQLQNANPDQFSSIIRESEAAISSIVAAHSPSEDMLYETPDRNKSYVPKVGEKVYVKGLGATLATIVESAAEDGTAMVQYGKIKVRVKGNHIRPMQSTLKHTSDGSSANLKQQVSRKIIYKCFLTFLLRALEYSCAKAVLEKMKTLLLLYGA